MLMKWTCFVLGLGAGAVFPVLAELPEPRAVERGPHHTLWQNVEEIIQATGQVDCRTSQYRPAVFTAKDDDTVGEKISGSSGNPVNHYAANALYIDFISSSVAAKLSNLRISFATNGVYFHGGVGHALSHAQIVKCQTSLKIDSAGSYSLRNGLICDTTNAFRFVGSETSATAENVTVDKPITLKSGAGDLTLNNSLIVQGGTTTGFAGTSNFVTSSSSVFKSVGSGYHYLAANTYRNAGTTNIDATLLSALRNRTTYPPIIVDDQVPLSLALHITNAVNVSGFFSWGVHGYPGDGNMGYATNRSIIFSGDSAWHVMTTVESYNGRRYQFDQSSFLHWFSSGAFGGTNYSNTPVGAATHPDEPFIDGVCVPEIYFGLWQLGKADGACGWQSSYRQPTVLILGDPLVTK